MLDYYLCYKESFLLGVIFGILLNYLFITYIVTSKPKRISVAAGLVHMMLALNKYQAKLLAYNNLPNIPRKQ